MPFDTRAMEFQRAGQHLTSSEFPGLRLDACADVKTWACRCRSPIEGKLRQTRIGIGWQGRYMPWWRIEHMGAERAMSLKRVAGEKRRTEKA